MASGEGQDGGGGGGEELEPLKLLYNLTRLSTWSVSGLELSSLRCPISV